MERRSFFVLVPVKVEMYIPDGETEEFIGNIWAPSHEAVIEAMSHFDEFPTFGHALKALDYVDIESSFSDEE